MRLFPGKRASAAASSPQSRPGRSCSCTRSGHYPSPWLRASGEIKLRNEKERGRRVEEEEGGQIPLALGLLRERIFAHGIFPAR